MSISTIIYITMGLFISIGFGIGVTYVIFFIYKKFKEVEELKKIPKDKSEFKDGHQIPINTKEVYKNEQEEQRRFREHERLRQIALGRIPTGDNSTANPTNSSKESSVNEGRQSIQNGDNFNFGRVQGDTKGAERDIKESVQRFKWNPF